MKRSIWCWTSCKGCGDFKNFSLQNCRFKNAFAEYTTYCSKCKTYSDYNVEGCFAEDMTWVLVVDELEEI